ncbi:MAG: ferric reductase-like transmembrane domain-containing protein [Actinomycetota bacterium]|jgi:methionine sulfoxide reductase heme-binding subunit
MIAFTSTYFWYTTRATGIVALLLLTLVVTLGTLVANRIGGTFVGRFELNELHRSISVVAMLFLFIHILTTVVDSYVSTGLISAFIPMTSAYKTIPIAIGAVGFDLLLCVWISSLLKVRIKNESWRFIHWFSWLAYASAIIHAYMSGSDTHYGAGLLLVAGCAGIVLNVALWRYFGRPERAAGRTALSPIPRGKTIPQRTDSFPRSAPTQKPRRR